MARFLISPAALERNAHILRQVGDAGGARMLVALKAFACTAALKAVQPYCDGYCASGLYEARLAQGLGGEVAVFSPGYTEDELRELLEFAAHIDFNSVPQWLRYRGMCLEHPRAKAGEILFGLRINPCHSTGHTPLYDPCAPGSRLGIPPQELEKAGADALHGISGLHIHTLCEQGAQELVDTFRAFEKTCGHLLRGGQLRYLNLGGGHWITKPFYDRDVLVALLREIHTNYGVQVYLEPGEAWAIHTGMLRVRVLDVFESLGYRHAILDASASAHTPDVLEMPYRPDVFAVTASPAPADAAQPAVCLPGEYYSAAAEEGQKPHTYRLGGPTCLAGDSFGDYSFDTPLHAGDELVLDDMSHYTMVKTTHFNGVAHPDIYLLHADGSQECVRRFGYSDYAERLG